MSNPGNRKQRYILDIDDVIKDGFMTKANAEALIRGINGSGCVVKLAVPMGGTNNAVFTDQELLKFDAATGKIVSSGVTGVLPGGQSVFVPWETQVEYKDTFTDKMTTSAGDLEIGTYSFDLGPNATWADLQVTFQFGLNQTNTNIRDIRVRLGASVFDPPGWFQPQSSMLYQVGATPDQMLHTWIGMGPVPAANNFEDPLVVHLWAKPQDHPSYRNVIVRASKRALGLVPGAAAQKGIPMFLSGGYVTLRNNPFVTGWQTHDLSAHIPDGASAAIVQTSMQMQDQNRNSQIWARKTAGAAYFAIGEIGTSDDSGGDDRDTNQSQNLVPLSLAGGVRSIDTNLTTAYGGSLGVFLLGYIT